MSKRSGSLIGLGVISVVCLVLIFYAVQFGMGSLYKKGLDNQFTVYGEYLAKTSGDDSEANKKKRAAMLENVNFLTDSMLKWNRHDPEHLTYAAYTELLNSYAFDNVDQFDKYVERSTELNSAASQMRPLYPDTYAQQAYALNGLSKPVDVVLAELHKSERFGPYEKATARAGIDFYFSFWDQLDADDRIKATDYVFNPRKFGLGHWDINQMIQGAAYKERVCNLLSFAGRKSRACNK